MEPSNTNSVQVHYETTRKGYYLLSIYNMHINAFLRLFKGSIITQLHMYWLDGEKDFVTSLLKPVQVAELNFQFDGLDVQILTVEIELDNGFVIDSNLIDELFCKVPPNYPMDGLVQSLLSTDNDAFISKDQSMAISSLSSNRWVTQSLDE